MKYIELTKGQLARVDDVDFEQLNKESWQAHKHGHTFYARRTEIIDGKKTCVYMHRQIMNAKEGEQIEHRDRNGLHCERKNLRFSTQQQNNMNKCGWGRSKYKGVSYSIKKYKDKIYTSIVARIKIGNNYKHLGVFSTEEFAALEYDRMAKIHFGEFANLNFK